jgi:aminopeptidase
MHAQILVDWSTSVKPGDKVLLRVNPGAYELALAVTAELAKRKASVVYSLEDDDLTRAYLFASEKGDVPEPNHFKALVEASDVIMGLYAPSDLKTLQSTDPAKLMAYKKARRNIFDCLMKKRWCDTIHPCKAFADQANMSFNEYKEFVYGAVLVDWDLQSKHMYVLKHKLGQHNEIRIIGKGTDLHARTDGRQWRVDDAKMNLPGGEVYTSPVEDSVEGKILLDIPFRYQGTIIENVRLKFEKGIVTDYSAEKGEQMLNAILDVDDGSSRIGELAFGMNPGIKRATLNMLFDEKMTGTMHLALGKGLIDCNGTNDSAIHVDILRNLRSTEIRMGEETIYTDGRFM